MVSPVQQEDCGKGHTTVIRLYSLDYNKLINPNIVSVISLAKRPLVCICHLVFGKTVLVSGLSRSSRAIKGQGYSTVVVSCSTSQLVSLWLTISISQFRTNTPSQISIFQAFQGGPSWS